MTGKRFVTMVSRIYISFVPHQVVFLSWDIDWNFINTFGFREEEIHTPTPNSALDFSWIYITNILRIKEILLFR